MHKQGFTASAVVSAAALVFSIGSAPVASNAEVRGDAPARITVAKSATVTLGGLGSSASSAVNPVGAPERTGPKRRGTDPLRTEPGTASQSLDSGRGTLTSSGRERRSRPELLTDWEGVNHRDSRLASDGNQFSGEPPDQGLCVGNGYVLATVNSALRVYRSRDGSPASGVVSLNELYGFPPAINRTTGEFGPFTFDISCHYDPDSRRWFHLAVDLTQDPDTGEFTGGNFLDLAVSRSGDPTGAWSTYRIPGVNDGTLGTPDHGCEGGPCFADFPHIGVDRSGVYITTNEFPLFGDGFTGAQVYAISKRALTRGSGSITAFLYNTADDPVGPDQPGATLWPALSAGKEFDNSRGGTQYFVSSNAVFDDANGDSEELVVWALTGTRSLRSGSGAPVLEKQVVDSQRYAIPPPSEQKPGSIPLGELLVGATEPGLIDTSDSRVLDVRYADRKLWAVLGTAARTPSSTTDRAGVAWFVLEPGRSRSGLRVRIDEQGILAMPDEALAYPTLGITGRGRGVIGFTRVGPDLFPSTGYTPIDDHGVGPVSMVEAGNSPQDGFTEYDDRPRWGDYGAAAVDGRTVFLANEYIEQGPCTTEELLATDCDGTRTLFANWSTRVAKLRP